MLDVEYILKVGGYMDADLNWHPLPDPIITKGNSMPKIALIDMDGTTFDHNAALKRDMLKIASPSEVEEFEKIEDWHALEEQPHIDARIKMIRSQPGWWLNLNRYLPGFRVYRMLKNIGFCCKILTKGPKTATNAWTEKIQCVQKHFGDDMPIDIVGKDKGGTYGRVLVDDYPDYLEKWLEHRPRGLGIMPAHPYNAHFSHSNVIRYVINENEEEVKTALQAAFDRKSKTSWKSLI